MGSTPDWNAAEYHRVSDVQFKWGLKVLADLELRGNEVVIDAGCGTGRLTAVLLERLGSGRVIALDFSEAMLDVARKELARFEDRVACVQADLADLHFTSVADVIFSNATFHWVLDANAMFKGLRAALKPQGRLHAQCGAVGNLARFMEITWQVAATAPFAKYFEGFVYPSRFATVEETQAALEANGFSGVSVWLSDEPTPFETREDFKAFVSTVVLRHAAGLLPPELLTTFTDTIVGRCEQRAEGLSLDYVRLNIRAHVT